jgi:flavin reductase (DIM6/NTAB) family NADH-FMN oxidoreductase RutF
MAATIDHADFRRALGRFPTGVAIATAIVDGERIGMTISSFNSVSIDPPLILFSVARSALSIDAWLRTESFAINLLAEHQGPDAMRFARARSDKWNDTRVRTGLTGSPLIDEAIATFECISHARYDGGDHMILVGRVVAIESNEQQRPLVFYSSGFCSLAPPPQMEAPG